MTMTTEQLQAHYRKAANLADGETYDPDVHYAVPCAAFGQLADSLDGGKVAELVVTDLSAPRAKFGDASTVDPGVEAWRGSQR